MQKLIKYKDKRNHVVFSIGISLQCVKVVCCGSQKLSVLGHEVVRLQRCTSDANHLMWASKFKTLVVFFSQHLTMICAPDARRSSLKLERFGGLSLAAAFQFLLHKPIQNVIERPNNMQMSRGNSAGLFRSRDTTTSNYNVSLGHCFLAGIVAFFFRQVRKKTKQTSCFQSAVACVKASRPCLAGKSLFFSFACCCRSSQINQFRSSESNSDSTWSFT